VRKKRGCQEESAAISPAKGIVSLGKLGRRRRHHGVPKLFNVTPCQPVTTGGTRSYKGAERLNIRLGMCAEGKKLIRGGRANQLSLKEGVDCQYSHVVKKRQKTRA